MPEMLTIEEFLQPIPGDNPAGEPVAFAVRSDLEEKRKEIDPEQYDASDPARPTEAKIADWPGIIDVATETLKTQSKDLLVAARLTEALTKMHGFAGLADGLAIMKGILDTCWDRCHPDISDGDLEVRAGPFNWLSDATRGARFPNSVRAVALVYGSDGPQSWQSWRLIQEGKGGTKDSFDQAVSATSREVCQSNLDDLNRCVREFTSVSELLATRIGPEAPGLVDLRAAIADCHTLAKLILERKGPAAGEDAGTEPGTESPSSGGGRSNPTANRDEIYRQIQASADRLETLEPHSPIPHLLRRAVSLGHMTFPQLIAALLSDGANLESIQKEFGLKPPESE